MKTLWNTITADDVMARFNAAEAAAFTAIGNGPQQLQTILQDAIDAMRGCIKTGGNQLGPDGTIPDSLKRELVSLVIWDWLMSFSKNEKLQTEQRKAKYDEATKKLEKISRGEIKTEIPDAGTGDTAPAPRNSIATIRPGRNVCTDKFDSLGTT